MGWICLFAGWLGEINMNNWFMAAGIRTAALLCPVIPYITEVRRLIDMLAPHTTKIWIYGLSILDPSEVNWQHVKRILKTHFPD